MQSRRELLKNGAAAAVVAGIGGLAIRQELSTWSSGELTCTGIVLDGGGIGEPSTIIFLASADGLTQVTIAKTSAEPFVAHQTYTITAV